MIAAFHPHDSSRDFKSGAARIQIGSFLEKVARSPGVIQDHRGCIAKPDRDERIVVLLTPLSETVPWLGAWKGQGVANYRQWERPWRKLPTKSEHPPVINREPETKKKKEHLRDLDPAKTIEREMWKKCSLRHLGVEELGNRDYKFTATRPRPVQGHENHYTTEMTVITRATAKLLQPLSAAIRDRQAQFPNLGHRTFLFVN